MRNVLFIVYYFPPMGSSGVQRPLKFVKYLRRYGWNPIVVAPEPGAYHTFDDSLQAELDAMQVEVHRVGAKTPFHLIGKSGRQIGFIPDRLAGWVRRLLSFFYLPDNKTGWIKPALQKAGEIMEDNDIDVIFSTATPYSNHLIAAELKRRTGKPVVMDFRDDWLDCHLSIYPTRLHRKKVARMERDCIKQADGITANNPTTLASLKSRCINPQTAFHLLEHGFDPDDFKDTSDGNVTDGKITFLYSGIFYEESRPDVFLQALSELLKEGIITKRELEIQFQGGLKAVHRETIRSYGLQDVCVDHGFVDHKEAVRNLFKADILWLIVGHQKSSDRITPGKLFEYMATHKPILGLVPEGDSKDILTDYKAGFICNPYEADEVKKTVRAIIGTWKKGSLPAPDNDFIRRFDRQKITGELAAIFNSCV